MSDQALVFHLNSSARILHMECLGGMKPYRPKAFCLGRTLEEITPNEIKINTQWLKEIENVLMNKHNYSYFLYVLDGCEYGVRMMYLREEVVLAVIQGGKDS